MGNVPITTTFKLSTDKRMMEITLPICLVCLHLPGWNLRTVLHQGHYHCNSWQPHVPPRIWSTLPNLWNFKSCFLKVVFSFAPRNFAGGRRLSLSYLFFHWLHWLPFFKDLFSGFLRASTLFANLMESKDVDIAQLSARGIGFSL